MTRKSKREIERAIEALAGGSSDASSEVVVRETVVKTGWSDDADEDRYPDADPGDVVEESTRVIEL